MKTGAAIESYELVIAMFKELANAIRKAEEKELQKYPFVLLKTRDGLLSMHPNFGRPEIVRALHHDIGGAYSAELPIHREHSFERRYRHWGKFAYHMDMKVPVFEEQQ